ncbi:gametocyte-specific factor 1 [Patagioenas fasciata monilis]|uniref:Gametocyte-specific factor 1 n=1 Tax=Patagioenas fasciata monilis TaxID=372326 RepID=A0A1V4JKB7_PATFA|nr:gametocyte-specific factor 1 [Patagioenas fasciata monilis]
MDPEQLVQCPYDKSHQIRVARLPYHLVKCEKNNPGVARRLATCPFNARHRVPRTAFQHHIASCPDKRQLDLLLGTDSPLSNPTARNETPPAWQGPTCQEDWEAELQDLEEQPPFILRAGANNLLLPSDSSAPAALTKQSHDGRAAGHRAHEGQVTVAAGQGQCLTLPQDLGVRGARGAVPLWPLLGARVPPTGFK